MKTRTRQGNSVKEKPHTNATGRVPPTLDEIRQRAHEIYTARGGTPGKELEDWLLAEQQLKKERAVANVSTTQSISLGTDAHPLSRRERPEA